MRARRSSTSSASRKEEVGRRVGRSRVAISNLVRLLELPDDVLAMLEAGELSEGHGRAMLQARDRNAQRALAREARDRGLSVRETEALARARSRRSDRRRASRPRAVHSADADAARARGGGGARAALGREVRVRLGRRGGTVEIPFDDLAEVARARAPRSPADLAA